MQNLDERRDLEGLKAELQRLAGRVAEGDVDSTDPLWGGADVVISPTRRPEPAGAFYPAPRQVITTSAPELSWLFTRLRDIFAEHYNGQTKSEFFGRLANAALRYQAKRRGDEVPGDLLAAVLHEAFAIADEMEEGTFRSLSVAVGNEIVDDYVDEAEREGFVGIEETRQFLAEKGVTLL